MQRSLFIVGPSRSGTELTRDVLNRHPDINITAETHYFDDLRPRINGGRARLSPDQRLEALNYFAALRAHTYGLTKLALTSSPHVDLDLLGETGDELFANFCGANPAPSAVGFWGEKTPRHLFRVDDMIAAFPNSKVLLLVRDPRSVVASYRDWQNSWVGFQGEGAVIETASVAEDRRIRASYSLAIIALLWRSAAQQAIALRKRLSPDQFQIVRFEDLVRAPEATLRDLCVWMGLPFNDGMLDVSVINSSYVKGAGPSGFNPSVAERWRVSLSRNEIGVIDLLTSGPARTFGYQASGMKASPAFLARELGATPLRIVRAVVANRGRVGALLPYLMARARGLAASPR